MFYYCVARSYRLPRGQEEGTDGEPSGGRGQPYEDEEKEEEGGDHLTRVRSENIPPITAPSTIYL